MKAELGRRGFLELTGAMAVPLMAGVDWDEHALGLDERVEGFGILLGPSDARPPADGEYFGQWDTYRFMYFSSDTGDIDYIQTDDSSWSAVANRRREDGSFVAGAASQSQETVSFSNTYDADRVTNSVGLGASGGLTGDIQATWAGYTTDADGNVTGMDVSYRNDTASDEDVIWEVYGWAL